MLVDADLVGRIAKKHGVSLAAVPGLRLQRGANRLRHLFGEVAGWQRAVPAGAARRVRAARLSDHYEARLRRLPPTARSLNSPITLDGRPVMNSTDERG